jgi:hypothetical protein
VNQPPPAADEESPSYNRKKGHGRRQIPNPLPRQDVPHDVSPEERASDGGRKKSRIGEDVTAQLEYEPGKMWALGHIYLQRLDHAASADRTSGPAGLELTATDLALLLTGVDVTTVRRRKRHARAG